PGRCSWAPRASSRCSGSCRDLGTPGPARRPFRDSARSSRIRLSESLIANPAHIRDEAALPSAILQEVSQWVANYPLLNKTTLLNKTSRFALHQRPARIFPEDP